MGMWKGIFCGFILILSAGCASSNIRPEDMSRLGAAPTQQDVDKNAHGKPLHRVDYLVDGRSYVFEVYEAADTARYYQLLFQDGKLIAVDMASGYTRDFGPATCMMFPASPGLDVEDCLRTEDKALQDASVDLQQPVTPDKPARQRASGDTAATAVEGVTMLSLAAVFAPVVIPLEVLSLSVTGAEKAGEKSAQQSLGVKLGDSYQDIQARVEQLPERDRSVKDGDGTVLVPSSFGSLPAAAFGVQGGKVIWLELDPPWECGNGFGIWGADCHVRTQLPGPWRAPQAPRPQLMDEWEDLSVYYTPPPEFQLLGAVWGKATGAFSGKSRMQNGIEDMKKQALKDGATAVLMYPDGREFTAAPAAGTGVPIYGPTGDAGFLSNFVSGLEIYVPADADAFQKAAPIHAATCDALSKKQDAADDAYDEAKDTGTKDAIAAAKQTLQAAKDAKDAAYCGDDDWYAEQMLGHAL
jgi:hypothetical protein